ncbi:MAG: phosphoenolpyruvate--protein phosphotransferase [Lachnospiraceae bacterium]|nr:phosphoenolpyruvate--protein phosphotransferase [Lachnospiraceae bacterium]
MKRIKGTVLSEGYGIGKAFLLKGEEALHDFSVKSADPLSEIERFRASLAKTEADLTGLSFDAVKKMGEEEAKIFEAQKMILADPAVSESIERTIADEAYTAEYAVSFYFNPHISNLEGDRDDFVTERAADVKDVKNMLLKNLRADSYGRIKGKVIVVAKEILPSMVVSFDRHLVKGIVTAKGSADGHAALLARALKIPMLTADIEGIENGTELIADAKRGILFADPDKGIKNRYVRKAVRQLKAARFGANSENYTVGKYQTALFANIASFEQGLEAAKTRVSGVGLFRTEFLFMKEYPPTEDEQFEVYKNLLSAFGERPVTVRTFDFGGDKTPEYLESFAEEHDNLRGIRFALMEESLLITQFKALLRASVYGNLRVSLPMVYDVSDIENAKDLMLRAAVILENEGYKRREEAECIERSYDAFSLGIMAETRKSILKASVLADNSDFFSIGTNDLSCELFNLNRFENHRKLKLMEKNLLFKSVEDCIDAAHRAGIEAGICGEEALNPKSAKRFIKAGADYLSI